MVNQKYNAFLEGLKKRLKNKTFWVALVSACILAIQKIAALFGVQLDLSGTESAIMDLLNTIFVILTILGITIDPTTPGITDGYGTNNGAPVVSTGGATIVSDDECDKCSTSISTEIEGKDI